MSAFESLDRFFNEDNADAVVAEVLAGDLDMMVTSDAARDLRGIVTEIGFAETLAMLAYYAPDEDTQAQLRAIAERVLKGSKD